MLPIWNLPGIKECSLLKNDTYPCCCHCAAWDELSLSVTPSRFQSPLTRGFKNTLSTEKPSKVEGYVDTAHFANQFSQLSPFESGRVNTVLLIDVEPGHVEGTGPPLPPVGYKYQFIAPSLLHSALQGPHEPG